VQIIRWLGTVVVAPRYLAVIGSLFDFAGPQIARRFRKALFRPLSGALAGSLYRRVTGISRLKATLGGVVAGCLCRIAIYGLQDLPKGGFLLARRNWRRNRLMHSSKSFANALSQDMGWQKRRLRSA
jgi:hypothetical protein